MKLRKRTPYEEMDKAYKDGERNGKKGNPVTVCPYLVGETGYLTKLEMNWKRGWLAGVARK